MKRTAIKRKTGLRRTSKKRAKESRAYTALRKVFLVNHPFCEFCEISQPGAPRPATEVHHKSGRGKFYLAESTWMAVCAGHHRLIHECPQQSRAFGYLK